MKKVFVLSIIVMVIMLFIYIVTVSKITPTNQNDSTTPTIASLPPIRYGILSFFNERITYPLIFDDISVDNNGISFDSQDGYRQDFQIFLRVEKTSIKKADELKAELMAHGVIKTDSRQTSNGYQGELLAADLKMNPDPNTQNCTVYYWYIVPLAYGKKALWLNFSVSQPKWQGMLNPTYKCSLYDDQNYSYFQSMLDHIIFQMIPSD